MANTRTQITVAKDLKDINITSLLDGQTLVASGGIFYNRTPTISGSSGHTIQISGASLSQRTYLNFTGAGVSVADDSANNRTNVTISGDTTTSGTPLDGWVNFTGTSTYLSADSFRMTGANINILGAKIRLKINSGYSGYRYFYVSSASYSGGALDVLVVGDKDLMLQNGTITECAYSFIESPTDWWPWFYYTPVWTGSSSNPALGTGVIYGTYRKASGIVSVEIGLTMGANTTYGTGRWQFSLPITSANTGIATLLDFGPSRAYDLSATAYYTLFAQVNDNSDLIEYFISNTAGTTASTLTSAVPFTWASGDQLIINMHYKSSI